MTGLNGYRYFLEGFTFGGHNQSWLCTRVLIVLVTDTSKTFYIFPSTEAVSAFSWEPGGSKFAIIHGESPRISASFYNMEKQGSVSLLSKYM